MQATTTESNIHENDPSDDLHFVDFKTTLLLFFKLSSFDRLSSRLLHIALAFNALSRRAREISRTSSEWKNSLDTIDVIVGVYFHWIKEPEEWNEIRK